MKKSELIKKLESIDGDFEIILSSDEESNSFDTLRFVGVVMYDRDLQSVGFSEITEELSEAGYTEEDVLETGEKVIILWP